MQNKKEFVSSARWISINNVYTQTEKSEIIYTDKGCFSNIKSFDFNNSTWIQARTDQYYYDQTLGVEAEKESASKVIVSPNPVADCFSITGDIKATQLEITNMTGNVVLKIQLTDCKNEVNVTTLPAGIYLVTIETEKGTFIQKIVKK